MRTPAQIEASRRNGGKSKGPITAEGQSRSSRNAIKHGLSSNKIVVFDGESEEAWEKYQTHFIGKFQPRDFVEERLVIQMAVNQWHLERVWSPQTATVDQESATQEEVVAAHYEPDLKALDQYESRFVRILDRALKQFSQIREQYPPQLVFENEPKMEIFENEPKIEILKNEPGTEISEEAAVQSHG
jgi:hypothetical protein